jgi:hypothetical protein
LAFRRGEENQDLEFLTDIEEAMFDLGCDEDHAACFHCLLFSSHPHASGTANDVVDLVLLMRLLQIAAAGGQYVHTDTQSRDTKKFDVELAGPSLFR